MSKCVKCGNEILTGDIHWEMGLCNKCYNELYKDHKTHISLDKMWLELAQSFRDENEKLQDKVADLETKLAESENQCRECKHLNKKIELNIKNKLMAENCELQKQLAEKEKVSPKSSIKEIVKSQDIKCFFRDKTLAQIQKCGDVYSPEYGYFNFEDDYDELLNNKKDDRFDIVAIEVIKTTKSMS